MVRSRTATAAVGLAVSLLVSVAAWHYFDTLFAFLFLPFVPLLWRSSRDDDAPPVRECPACGFATRDPSFAYCPRDGTPLDRRGDGS